MLAHPRTGVLQRGQCDTEAARCQAAPGGPCRHSAGCVLLGDVLICWQDTLVSQRGAHRCHKRPPASPPAGAGHGRRQACLPGPRCHQAHSGQHSQRGQAPTSAGCGQHAGAAPCQGQRAAWGVGHRPHGAPGQGSGVYACVWQSCHAAAGQLSATPCCRAPRSLEQSSLQRLCATGQQTRTTLTWPLQHSPMLTLLKPRA